MHLLKMDDFVLHPYCQEIGLTKNKESDVKQHNYNESKAKKNLTQTIKKGNPYKITCLSKVGVSRDGKTKEDFKIGATSSDLSFCTHKSFNST